MEDQKVSDKRKAPDKNNTSFDLNESSLIEQPLKRARMDEYSHSEKEDPSLDPLPQPEEDERDDLIIDQQTRANDPTMGDQAENILDIVEPVNTEEASAEPNLTGENVRMSDGQTVQLDNASQAEGLPNGNSSKEELEIASARRSEELNELDIGEDGENNNRKDTTKFINDSQELSEDNDSKPRISSGNNGTPTHDQVIKSGQLSQLGSSSNEFDLGMAQHGVLNLSIRAYNAVTNKVIYEGTSIKSDYLKLEAFLNQHSRSCLHNNVSGYSGDVDSEEHLTFPPPTTTSRKNRFTSSTLGSSIPRESMKTVYSISPNDSPDINRFEQQSSKSTKKRGKHEPKLTSTRLSEEIHPVDTDRRSSQLENMPVSNGQGRSNGFETPKMKSKALNKATKSSAKKSSSTSTSSDSAFAASKGGKQRGSKTPSNNYTKKRSESKPRSSTTPKSRTASKELNRLSTNSPQTAQHATVDPSPARAVAIVEGAAARPLTRFEQEVNNEPVDELTLKSSKTLWGTIAPNNPVFARWSDKNYYSGIVKEKGLNDTWIIDFDDATTYPASEGHIIPIKILGVGIEGIYCPDSGYHPANARVIGQKFVNDPDIGETVKYAIKLLKDGGDDDEVLWCTRRMLSIREHDARVLRQEFQPTAKLLKAAEVSLENVIHESRRRIATSLSKTTTTPKPATPKTPARRIVGGVFDASTADELSESISTPKRKTPKKKANDSTLSSLSSSSISSGRSSRDITTSDLSSSFEKSGKESPKKLSRSKDKDESHSVFKKYSFFLTASGGGDPSSLGSQSGSVPYDKDEYRDLIESKGGTIIDTVGEEEGKDKIFLISDNYARTVKYIYCLAASIPCVSHKWIQECISQNKIVPWKSYELNAGWSLEENKVIPAHKHRPLQGFEIYVTAGSEDLYSYWKPVLTAADAKLLKPKKVKGKIIQDEIPVGAKVLVTDASCSPDLLGKAHERMLPIVKPEWLVQTIIAGKKADFFNCDKYRVEVPTDSDYDEEEDENYGDENRS